MQIKEQRQQKDMFFKQHSQSPIPADKRASFEGLAYYAVDEAMDLMIDAEEFADKKEVIMQTSTGDQRPYLRWGKITFEVDGEDAELTLYFSPQLGHFFLPFMDATSGDETYGAGRYIDPELKIGKTFHIDFNQAYSPYCAYNPNYSCPIPPKENRLSVPIRVGEKNIAL